MKKQYKVGIYCRLSVDDASNSAKAKHYIPGDESTSIENQYAILSKFVMLNGWVEVKTYRDDGYSGGNFQRPGFLEMLEDARHGLINLILVKDLSRLGRDFVEVGRYTDVIFPALGCRFVSVLDCLDSEGDNTDMLHFRSLMNDYHLKDLSSKIKSVLYAKKKSGQYLTAYAPYGYRKSADDKHRLEIDEEAAAVVRRIFQMRYSGMAYGKIAAALNRDGILPPRWHWEMRCGKGHCKYSKLWAYATVRNILNDDVGFPLFIQGCAEHGNTFFSLKLFVQFLNFGLDIFFRFLTPVDTAHNLIHHCPRCIFQLLYGQYDVHTLCEAMNVPRGTFYNHILRNKRSNAWFEKRREQYCGLIREVFDEYRQVMGAEKIRTILVQRGHQISKEYVAKLMKEMGLASIRSTAKQDYMKLHKPEKKRNVLRQQFQADRPNQIWVSDVTCFKLGELYLYTCIILDLFSRRVVAYKVSRKNSPQTDYLHI